MITIDATALTLDVFIITGVGQFKTAEPRTLTLNAGAYTFGTLFGPTFSFSVTAAGTVQYDPALTFLKGVGTTTLKVNGFQIKVDATALTLDVFHLSDTSSGLGENFNTGSVQTLTLIPGSYRLGTLFGSSFVFSVNSTGMVHYDPALTFLTGSGTATLKVKGFQIMLDATALTLDVFHLSDTGSGLGENFKTSVTQTITLLPGTYGFGTLFGSRFVFTVTGAGVVAYDAGLTFLSGAGTGALKVNGFQVKVDATPLTFDVFHLSDTGSGLGENFKTDSAQLITLIPGSYAFGTLFGSRFIFSLDRGGKVVYDAALTFLSGAGTTTLKVNGFQIKVDATPLTFNQFRLGDTGSGMSEFLTATRIQTVTLIPGSYVFGTLFGPTFVFSVTGAGTVAYDAGLNFLAGAGTATLEVNGLLLMVDATRLGAASFSLRDAGSGLGENFPANVHQCLILIPGTYGFASGFSFPFSVTGGGVFDYDPALAPCVTGLGTQRLRVSCNPSAP